MTRHLVLLLSLQLFIVGLVSCGSSDIDLDDFKKRCGEEIAKPLEDCRTNLTHQMTATDQAAAMCQTCSTDLTDKTSTLTQAQELLKSIRNDNCSRFQKLQVAGTKFSCSSPSQGDFVCVFEVINQSLVFPETSPFRGLAIGACLIKCGKEGPVPPYIPHYFYGPTDPKARVIFSYAGEQFNPPDTFCEAM